MRVRQWVLGLLSLGLLSCDREKAPLPQAVAPALPSPSAASSPAAPASLDGEPGDAARGKALVQIFECNRCHDGTGHEPMANEKHCAHCHDAIFSGKVRAPRTVLAGWKKKVSALRDVPSLESAGARFRPEWIEHFLLEPSDVRPGLVSTMPRLALSPQQARDLAAYLTKDAPPPARAFNGGSVDAGGRIFERKSCGRCHAFTGAPGVMAPSFAGANDEDRRAIALAPDLRVVRDRFRAGSLVDWLLDPAKMKPGTLMPHHGLTPEEARDTARFLMEAPLAAPAEPVILALPKPLGRRVPYAEVKERVLGVTCGHCHGNPDVALGDGGPGNTGGFGFAPKRIDLSTYAGVATGYVDAQGERQSLFSPNKEGIPRLVAALMARHAEVAGRPDPEVRGMPLGLPPLPLEEIQLVATWVAQGRPN